MIIFRRREHEETFLNNKVYLQIKMFRERNHVFLALAKKEEETHQYLPIENIAQNLLKNTVKDILKENF